MQYSEDLANGVAFPESRQEAPKFVRMSPKDLMHRRQIFKGILLTMARDHHRAFLKTLNPPLEVKDSELTNWHRDFVVDDCPDVDMVALPEKPNVVRLSSAAAVFAATQRGLGGVNKRLEEALKEQAEKQKPEVKPAPETPAAEKPKVRKGLEGLPPALLEKILAKEKAKQIKEMTRTSEDKRELETLEELQLVMMPSLAVCRNLLMSSFFLQIGPKIMNCYRSEKHTQGQRALEISRFVKFVADSYGSKSVQEMDSLVRDLIRLAPGHLEIWKNRGTEYVREMKKGGAGCGVDLKKHFEKLLTQKRRA